MSIKISDIEEEKAEVVKEYKERLAPLMKERAVAIDNLKKKSETKTEECFKFFDEETKMVGFYNREGQLVNSRPAFPNEMQRTVFQMARTGTSGNY